MYLTYLVSVVGVGIVKVLEGAAVVATCRDPYKLASRLMHHLRYEC